MSISKRFKGKKRKQPGKLPTPPVIGGYKTTIQGKEVWVKQYDSYYKKDSANRAYPRDYIEE